MLRASAGCALPVKSLQPSSSGPCAGNGSGAADTSRVVLKSVSPEARGSATWVASASVGKSGCVVDVAIGAPRAGKGRTARDGDGLRRNRTWLGSQDSNLDSRFQRPERYPYATPQRRLRLRET